MKESQKKYIFCQLTGYTIIGLFISKWSAGWQARLSVQLSPVYSPKLIFDDCDLIYN